MPELTSVNNEQYQRLEVKIRRELGETILGLLDNEAVEDIVLNPDSTLWVKQMGSGFRHAGQMSASQAVCAMNTIASMRSMVLNYERPVLETELPLDGSRFEGLIPPVVRHPVFAIRRRPRRIFTLDQYCQSGILTGKTDPLNRLPDARTSPIGSRACLTPMSSAPLSLRKRTSSRRAPLAPGRRPLRMRFSTASQRSHRMIA
jgi:Flp pilus assembly CpaF family ATPase